MVILRSLTSASVAALRSVHTKKSSVVGAGAIAGRALSGKPPEAAEVDDTEEIERAMETIVAAKGGFGGWG